MSALTGLKVLELGTLIAGPFAARIFGEFGADVIKVETPHGPDGTGGGDPIRSWRHLHEGNSLWWTVQARNKQSIALNLKDPRAREIARKLALDADVVVENYRPGVLEKWGLGYEQLRAINPDSIAALHGVIGAMMALRHRDATGGRWNGKQGAECQAGQGQMVDVALYEAVFNMMESLVPEYDVAGVVRERTGGALPGIVPSNTYTTRDGQNIVIAGNGDAIFHRLMRAIGRDDLATDPGLVRNDGRAKRVDEIDGAIQQWCGARGIEEALGALKGADVPVGKIYSVADMFSDPQFLARRMIEQHRFPDGTPVKLPAVVPKLSETPGETRWVGPVLGEHTEEVLKSLGYDSAAIEELAKTGAIGLPDN
jgi:formyl-CoA transferase